MLSPLEIVALQYALEYDDQDRRIGRNECVYETEEEEEAAAAAAAAIKRTHYGSTMEAMPHVLEMFKWKPGE